MRLVSIGFSDLLAQTVFLVPTQALRVREASTLSILGYRETLVDCGLKQVEFLSQD